MKEPKEGYKYQDDTRPKIEYDSGSEHYLRAEDEFWHIFNSPSRQSYNEIAQGQLDMLSVSFTHMGQSLPSTNGFRDIVISQQQQQPLLPSSISEQDIELVSHWQTLENEDCESHQDDSSQDFPPNLEDNLPPLDEFPFGTADGNNNQSNRKRPRRSYDLKDKLEIIFFKEQNPHLSVMDISERLGIARSTIYGILKKRDSLLNHVRLIRQDSIMMEKCRIGEPKFRILEELLAAWCKDRRNRGTIVECRKICAQAIDIHRILSSLLSEPLPPCIFSTGWLKGFKNRTGISCCSTRESQRHTPTQTEKADWKNKMIIWKLDKYSHDDIYTCDLATMFLSAVPGQSMMPSKRDSSSVSVLLGCSANGRHKLDPVVLVRQSAGEFEVGGGYNGYNDVVLDAQLDDLTSSTFENWLSEFDSSIGRKVFLFVDQPLWDMVSKGWGILKPPLRHVKIVPVPRWLSASLPMNQMIIKEFKAFFHAHVLENTKARMHYMPKQPMNDVFVGSYNRRYNLQDPTCASSLNAITPSSQEPLDKAFRVCPINSPLSQPRPIYEAWSQVSSLVIVQSFQTFFKEAEFPEMQRMADIITLRDKSIGQTRLKYVLENVLSLPEEEWISRYYQNHDLDIGPSSFIRERILVMQHHQDFRHCFGNIDFGFVRFGGKRPVGGRIKRFENVLQKELAHSKMLLDQYNFGSNVLPKLLFLGRCTLGSYEL